MFKRTGFNRPFHSLQILSWILFTIDISAVCFIIIPILDTNLQLVFGPILVVSSIAVLVLAVFLTKSDPTDYTSLQDNAAEEDGFNRYCTACVRRVDFTAKHCMRCNRCVVRFDHHCKFVNNCIGLANYRIFVYVMISLEVFLIGLSVSSIILIVESRADYEEYKEKVNELYGDAEDGVFWVLILIVLETSILNLLILYLLCLHLWLRRKGMTTFEYILKRHKVVPQNTKRNSEEHLLLNDSRIFKKREPESHSCPDLAYL